MTDELKIEQGIPMPEKTGGKRTSVIGQAVRSMKVGDSFLGTNKNRHSAFAIASKIGIKLASRKDGEDSVRVWRTE